MRIPCFLEPEGVLPGTAVQDVEEPRECPRRLDGVTDGEVLEGRIRTTAKRWTEIVRSQGKYEHQEA